ncbi:hypothetical protein ACHAWF_017131 [Thalassiosira exigua]
MAAMVRNDDVEGNVQRSIGPALIDVDCNLLHADLMSVMGSMSSVSVSDEIPDVFKILHHPATVGSNVAAMISPSSTIDESNGVCVKTTVGVHPYHAEEEGPPGEETLSKLRALLDGPDSKQTISCIGETSLNYSEGFPDREQQIPWFEAQLDLAFEYDLPIFLHEQMAFNDTLICIDEATRSTGESVCQTSSCTATPEHTRKGYYASIAGGPASCGSDEVKECLREGIVPMDRLMLETDAPYMGFGGNKDACFVAEGEAFASLPAKKRKRLTKSTYPNVPSSLPLVLRAVCDEFNMGRAARGETELFLHELARTITKNAIAFFEA